MYSTLQPSDNLGTSKSQANKSAQRTCQWLLSVMWYRALLEHSWHFTTCTGVSGVFTAPLLAALQMAQR